MMLAKRSPESVAPPEDVILIASKGSGCFGAGRAAQAIA
jgi:hypothetical protein